MEATHWVAVRPHDLVWREWGEYGAVYDVLSGSTHVLHALALELLALVSVSRLNMEQLLAEFADAMPPQLDAGEVVRQVGQQLQLLQELGLVTAELGQP